MRDDASMRRVVPRDRNKKLKRIVIWTIFGHEAIHINLSFTGSRKSKDVEIVEAEI